MLLSLLFINTYFLFALRSNSSHVRSIAFFLNWLDDFSFRLNATKRGAVDGCEEGSPKGLKLGAYFNQSTPATLKSETLFCLVLSLLINSTVVLFSTFLFDFLTRQLQFLLQ